MKFRILLPVLLFVFGTNLPAEKTETTIRVVVKNQYDKPVENAAVILDFLGSHQITKLGKRKPIHWEVKTNQEGVAHFPPVPEGTVQLQVINSRYQTYGKKIDVEGEEKTIDITLNPPQKQYSAHPPLKPANPPPPQN
ncbi:MAG: carboxypeptidase regulatory-like domain-containing protein [Acidobacteriaceae bacterium]|nr:carboxypeptidase regulatory-like domain-containing protein [Acidobacteriaceae bacterium]MBV9499217.1 carboxypeptidase regulatory-like domain-containing protein [Acidobacteriaceae bacterium]